ncbi:MAG: hypothetical protein M3P30_14055 [Chloroflexota bacterium]|nr:hypothetical protein [Chloroflexota bacterium]
MTSESAQAPVAPAGIGLHVWQAGAPAYGRPAALGLAVIIGLVLVGLSVVASAFVVHAVNAAVFNGGQRQTRSASAVTTARQESLKVQSSIVYRRRAAVQGYAAGLSEFKAATSRLPGAVGINLDAAEARRRDDVLAFLVLDCINAVDGYNLAAQVLSVTQLESAILPERLVWAVDCASVP